MNKISYKYYKVYGLVIKSEIELLELEQIDSTKQFDVIIKKGITPDSIINPEKIGVRFQAKKNELLLFVDNICKFYITNGNSIIIENTPTATISEIKLFLLGSAFGALIFQRGQVPFHGSTVLINNKAVIISGISGVGKSTITAKLTQLGYPIIADDVSVIDEINNKIYVYPGFARIKLWADTIELLNINNDLQKIRPQLEKYSFPIEKYHNKKTEINTIIVLKTKNTKGVEIEEIKGIEKFKILNNNIYRKQFSKPLKTEQEQFKIISKLSSKVKLYIVQRPNNSNSINEIIDKLNFSS